MADLVEGLAVSLVMITTHVAQAAVAQTAFQSQRRLALSLRGLVLGMAVRCVRLFGQVLQGKNAFAMDAGAANLDAFAGSHRSRFVGGAAGGGNRCFGHGVKNLLW